MSFLIENWEICAAVVTAFWAIFVFTLTRRKELAWKRTEFIVEQLSRFDNDQTLSECTKVLYGIHPDSSVDQFVEAATPPFDNKHSDLVIKFEKYLNFLWRICFAYLELGTLSKKDLWAFGFYLRLISSHPKLRDFCLSNGYQEIIMAADDLNRSGFGSGAPIGNVNRKKKNNSLTGRRILSRR